jgi:hypothetical protein
MKINYKIIILFITVNSFTLSQNTSYKDLLPNFDPNNIRTCIWNTGIFNQSYVTGNSPGFEWPKGTGKYAVYTTGLCIGAYYQGNIRLANASYSGEYCPGYIDSGEFKTDIRFKVYSVRKTDSYISNPDWINWAFMVPFGAPYVDVNHNGFYEYVIDTPGVKGAAQTVFVCLTDADPSNHSNSEGFYGGTLPLGAEVHLTAWGYDLTNLQDIQFFKWVVINKNFGSWDSTYFTIVCDPDLGDANDDYIGCDTVRKLGYCYNADNMDGTGSGISYGANPPAVGFLLLKSAVRKNIIPNINLGMTSFIFFTNPGSVTPVCESDPSSVFHAYNYMKGLKRDGTSFLCPLFNPPRRTKYVYSGDPETNTGWTEYQGRIGNCNGDTIGNIIVPSPPGDRRFVLSSGSKNLQINANDTQTIIMAQLIARGTSNLNSVTKLKQLADVAIQLFNNGFVIGVEPVSSEIPQQFKLYQNYPNPFNPSTKIKFQIPAVGQRHSAIGGFDVRLVIYDLLGREIAFLIPPLRGRQEGFKPGTYEVEWNGINYPSGVYFYQLSISNDQLTVKSETKKMVLIK